MKKIVYTIPSTVGPVSYGSDLSIPTPPASLNLSSNSGVDLNISKNEGSFSNPKIDCEELGFTQSEFNEGFKIYSRRIMQNF